MDIDVFILILEVKFEVNEAAPRQNIERAHRKRLVLVEVLGEVAYHCLSKGDLACGHYPNKAVDTGGYLSSDHDPPLVDAFLDH